MGEKVTSSLEAKQEGEKLFFDSMKHLTTLSSGSILLLVAFLEKLFQQPQWKAFIVVALISFILSILCSVSSMVQSANYVKHSGRFDRFNIVVKDVVYYSSLVTFLLGFVSLVVFAVKNFLAQ